MYLNLKEKKAILFDHYEIKRSNNLIKNHLQYTVLGAGFALNVQPMTSCKINGDVIKMLENKKKKVSSICEKKYEIIILTFISLSIYIEVIVIITEERSSGFLI